MNMDEEPSALVGSDVSSNNVDGISYITTEMDDVSLEPSTPVGMRLLSTKSPVESVGSNYSIVVPVIREAGHQFTTDVESSQEPGTLPGSNVGSNNFDDITDWLKNFSLNSPAEPSSPVSGDVISTIVDDELTARMSNISLNQDEEPRTPEGSSLGCNKSPVESAGSNRNNSTTEAGLQFPPDAYARNSGVGPIGVTKFAEQATSYDLTSDRTSAFSDTEPENSESSLDSEAADESSCSFLTNLTEALSMELFEQTDDKGNTHFLRKSFPRAPSVDDRRREEELLRQLKEDKGVANDDSIIRSLEQFKIEYLDTKPTYRDLEELKREKREYKNLWQVSSMSKKKVCEGIRRLYRVMKKQEKRRGERCFLLKKEEKIVYVKELKCYVLKGKRTYRCEYNNGKTGNVFDRVDCLLTMIHRLLSADQTANLHRIPYQYEEVFHSTKEVTYVLDYICKTIGCNRDSLNIFASTKGKIAGDIKFKVTNQAGRSHTTYCEGGVNISPRDVAGKLEFEKLTEEELFLILVVEKDTIFQILVEEHFHKRFRCIIITGCGKPDVASRTILKGAKDKLDLPVVALTDHNADGFEIYLTYLCGSEKMAHENLSTPDIKWLGLSPSDLIEHDIPQGNKVQLGLERIKNKDFVKTSQASAEEVGKMKTKVDLDRMLNRSNEYLTKIFLPLKFQRLGDGRTYN